MKTRILAFIGAVGLSLLSGCEAVSVDATGAIPARAAAQLTPYRGEYGGALRLVGSRSGTRLLDPNFRLRFDLREDRPVLEFEKDLLGSNCASSVGRLRDLTVHGPWDAIATFDFNPGACPREAQGRTVTIYLKQGRALLAIQKDTKRAWGRASMEDRREYRVELSPL